MDWRRLGGLLRLGLGVGLCLVVVPEADWGESKQKAGLGEVQAHLAFRKLVQAESLKNEGRLQEGLRLVDEAQAEFEAADLSIGVGMAQLLRGNALSRPSTYHTAALELDAAIHALCGDPHVEHHCARAHRERGQLAYKRSESSAMTHLNEALRIYLQLQDPVGEAKARRSIGDIFLFRGSVEEALTAYKRTLALYQTVKAPMGEASAHLGIGDVLLHKGFLEEALTSFEQALALSQTVQDPLGEAAACLRIGDVLLRQGSPEEARMTFEQALSLYQTVPDPVGEANAHLGIGDVLSRQGSLEEARTAYEQAMARFQAMLKPLGEANSLVRIGEVLRHQGSLEKSRTAFEQAMVLYQSVQYSLGEANARRGIGEVLLLQGSFEEAHIAFEQARAIHQAMHDPLGEAHARRGIGEVLFQKGIFEEALTAYEQALALYQAMHDPLREADTLTGIGDVLRLGGALEEALTAYEQALALYQTLRAVGGEANVRIGIGRVLLRQGSVEEARKAFEQGLALSQDLGNPFGRLNALLGLAHSYGPEDAASRTRAWEYAQRAFAVLRDEVQADLGGQTALRRFSEAYGHVLTDLILLAIELDHPEDALNAHLLLQGRGLIWSRGLTLRAQEGSVSPEVRALVERYESTQDSLGLALSTLWVQEDSKALTALRAARWEQEALEGQLGAHLGLAPQHFAPPTTAELQAALRRDPNHPVLAVFLNRGTELPVFVLDGESLTVHRILGEGVKSLEWSVLVQTTDDLVQSLHGPGLATNTADQRSALSGFPLAQAHTLYNALVAPWDEALDCDPGPCRPLLIVPDGVTHWVPFAALPTELPNAPNPDNVLQDIISAPYLGRSVPITLLPTPALLLPRFQSTHPQAGAAVMGSPANANFIAAEQQEVAGVWARLQVEACASQGAHCPEAPLTGKEAAELTLQTWLPQVRYLHISSHGMAGDVRVNDLGYPYTEPVSRLVLADAPIHTRRGAKKGEAKGVAVKGLAFKTGPEAGLPLGTPDGYLYKEEVQRFGSMPEMIVLSSCSSALGESNLTEGFAGVTYGLLAAGSSGVISAAWPVRVEATRDQMLALYHAHFEDGQDWATALMSSRIALAGELEGMPLEHPYFWAGFNLYGYVPPQP